TRASARSVYAILGNVSATFLKSIFYFSINSV
ncbi:unnamed protein product, partial [marine sediment metagenome]